MSTSCPSEIDVRFAEASSVIVHHVPTQQVDQFLEWEKEITRTAKGVSGDVKTEVYPPTEANADRWVVVMTFANQGDLNRWLESPERADCLAKKPAEMGSYSVEKMPGGFGAWFAGLDRTSNGRGDVPVDRLPGWKTALVVLLALYPTVMLLTLFVYPWLTGIGLAFTILIGNILIVSILQWILMPPLMAILHRWLVTPPSKSRLLNLSGALGIAAILGCLAVLFHAFSS